MRLLCATITNVQINKISGGIKMKKFYKFITVVFSIVFLLILNTSLAKADTSKDFGSDFITSAKVTDSNNVSKESYSPYDDINVSWKYNITESVHKNDRMTINVPSFFLVNSSITFPIESDSNEKVGTATVNSNNTLTVVFDKDFNNGLSGSINLKSKWNINNIKLGQINKIDWNLNSNVPTDNIKINDYARISPDEEIYKWGTVDGNTIHWVVRVNYKKAQIDNAIFTDEADSNQSIVKGSVKAYPVNYTDDIGNYTILSNSINGSISYPSDNQFIYNLGNINQTVLVEYDARIKNNDSYFQNKASLTGGNITPSSVEVKTYNINGNGTGNTTNTNVPSNNPGTEEPKTTTNTNVPSNNPGTEEPETTTNTNVPSNNPSDKKYDKLPQTGNDNLTVYGAILLLVVFIIFSIFKIRTYEKH